MGPDDRESEIRRSGLARAGSGDRQVLRFVDEATSAKLFGVVLRILKDRSEAEDVLQEVSSATVKRIPTSVISILSMACVPMI